MLGITDDNSVKKNKAGKRKRRGVTFNDEECVINPEDVDPNVGRFRNLISSTVVPTKRPKLENNYIGFPSTSSSSAADMVKQLHPTSFMPHLYQDLPTPLSDGSGGHGSSAKAASHAGNYALEMDIAPVTPALGSKLGLMLPNPAPDVAPATEYMSAPPPVSFGVPQQGKMLFLSVIIKWGELYLRGISIMY